MKPGKLYHRSIEVTPSDNMGWFVRIGCHTFVYGDDYKEIVRDLSEFFKDPGEFEKRFRKDHRKTAAIYEESDAPERPSNIAGAEAESL